MRMRKEMSKKKKMGEGRHVRDEVLEDRSFLAQCRQSKSGLLV